MLVRMRPPTEVEMNWSQSENARIRVDADQRAIIVQGPKEPEIFSYDNVADQASTQEEIFRIAGRPTTDNCLRGYNGTIIA